MVNVRGGASGSGTSKSRGKGKRQRQQPMEEDLPEEFDQVKFPTAAHQVKFNKRIAAKKTLLEERGIQYKDFDFRDYFIAHKWGRLARDPGNAAEMLVQEFYSNGFEENSTLVHLRGQKIDFSADSINQFLGLRRFLAREGDDYHPLLQTQDHESIADVIGRGGGWKIQTGGERKYYHMNMKYNAQVLYNFIRHRILPCSHTTWVVWERGVMVYCIMTDKTINVGKVIHDTMANMMKEKSKQGLGYGGLITAMATAKGVELPQGEMLCRPMSMLEISIPQQRDIDSRPPNPHPVEAARAPAVDRIGTLMEETRDWMGRMELRQQEQYNENRERLERMEGRQERMENRMDGWHEQQGAMIQQMHEWMLRQQGGNLQPPDY